MKCKDCKKEIVGESYKGKGGHVGDCCIDKYLDNHS